MSGPSTENPRSEPRDHPQVSDSAATDSDKPSAHVKPQGAVLDCAGNCINSDEEKHRSKEREFWRRQIRISKGLNWITAVAAVVGLGGMLVLYETLKEAERAGDSATTANRINQRSLEANTRAWIVPGVVTIQNFTAGQPLKFTIQFTNAGKEPALNVVEYNEGVMDYPPAVNAFILSVRNKWDQCKTRPAGEGSTVVFPSVEGAPHMQYDITAGGAVDDEFVEGKKVFAFYGCFAYETLGKIHHSSFCRSYSINIGVVGCFTGEYAD